MCLGKVTVLNFKDRSKKNVFSVLKLAVILGWMVCCPGLGHGDDSIKEVPGPVDSLGSWTIEQGTPLEKKISTEERIEKIESTLESIKITGEKAEGRSYYNKMISLELVHYVKIMVGILIVIAVVFPVTIWLMSRKRLLGLSGLSTEVTATLLVVEERQAKLANILKEIQEEIDYLHTMSATDLKKLIDQAEKYLKQNKQDLERAGSHSNTGKLS
jgi:hypothetical protein